MDAKTQLQDVQQRLSQLNPNNRDHLVEISRLKQMEMELQNQIRIEDQNQAVQQAHEQRVTEATTSFNSDIETLDLGGGITLRQLIGNEDYYQLATIGIKGAFQAQADNFSKQIADLQKSLNDANQSNDQLRTKLAQLADENADLSKQLADEKSARQQAEQYRDNAANQIDELNKVIDQKNGHIDDLQKQIAVGVKGSLQIVNSEEDQKRRQEIAVKFKREHTVYDVVPDDPINPKNYTAKLAYNDQEVTYNWIAKNSYTVIDANEVSSFRSQYGTEPVAQDNPANPALDQSIQAPPSVTNQEPQFPIVSQPTDTASAENVANEQQGVQQEGPVTREEFEALEKRVAAIERHANLPGVA